MITKKVRKIRKMVAKITMVTFLFANVFAPVTYGVFYYDNEQTSDNLLSTTNLDMEFTSDTDNFDPDSDWIPGSSAVRTGYIDNVGALPFLYSLEYQYDSGNQELCEALEFRVTYLWNDGDDQEDVKYVGPLHELNIPQDDDPDFAHPNTTSGDDPHEFLFEVWLPIDADEGLADEDCIFDIRAVAWMEEFAPEQAFWDEEFLNNDISTFSYNEPQECTVDDVIFMIGDEEDSQSDNPADELNWSGEFGVFPDFADPFVVGTNSDDEFPWNSNFVKDEATDFDIEFYYTGDDALVELSIGWSPGRSDDEQKEVFLDGESVGTTPVRNGTSVSGWWENMERFEDKVTFVLEPGMHTLNLKHLEGDGTLWDYVKLQVISCGADEHDILINEIMWSGSSEHERDEWIELYNDTDSEISLDGWVITGSSSAFHPIELVGTIGAHDYYLITRYPPDHDQPNEKAAINDSISADLVDPLMHLRDQGEKLTLEDSVGNTVDETPDAGPGGDGWAAGEAGSNSGNSPWRSMERNDTPGDGSNPSNWHTCIDDLCNDTTYWDEEGDDYGTPKAENHSENDPSDKDSSVVEETVDKGVEEQKAESDESATDEETEEIPGLSEVEEGTEDESTEPGGGPADEEENSDDTTPEENQSVAEPGLSTVDDGVIVVNIMGVLNNA